MRAKQIAFGLLTAGLLASAAPVFAADQGAGPLDRGYGVMDEGMGAGTMHPMMLMHGPMMMMGGKHIEGHLAFLKTELKITAKQEPAWAAFADTMRANNKRMMDMMAEMPKAKMDAHASAPDAMKMHIDMMQKHLDSMRTMQAAVAKLYSGLDDPQKKTADELLGMGPMMMGGHH